MRSWYVRTLLMQRTEGSCGPATVQSALAGFGKRVSQAYLFALMKTVIKKGTTEKRFLSGARRMGLRVRLTRHATLTDLKRAIRSRRAVIIGYREPDSEESHWALAVKASAKSVLLDDPWNGPSFRLSWRRFRRRWTKENGWMAVLWPRHPDSR